MLWVERKPRHASRVADAGDSVASEHASTRTLEQITWKQALLVGFAQCLAMIPGTSRPGATIIRGKMSGIDCKAPNAFSFFSAIPPKFAAQVNCCDTHGCTWSCQSLAASRI